MSDVFETMEYGDGVRGRRRSITQFARSNRERSGGLDAFAQVKHGLDSHRSALYRFGTTGGRMPNVAPGDLTRRDRSLEGGPGDRFLTQLDLWTERELSRLLRDQSTIFDGMVGQWAAEVIQTGFRITPRTGSAELDELVKLVLCGWDGDGGWFAECDDRGLNDFWELLTLSEETELTDGDHAFYLDPTGNDGRGSVAIIEGDRILTPVGVDIPDGFTISNGVLLNERGRPVAFWIADVAPTSAFARARGGDFYPAFDPNNPAAGGVLFSVRIKRATATRRQPWLSTAVRTHDELDDVFTAVRVLLRNAACRATYTEIKDWEEYKDWLALVSSSAAPAPTEALEHTPNPGDHTNLNPGESGGVWETNAPGENFDPFVNLQLGLLGLPLGMCLEESVRVFQKNFSASRMAVGGTRRRYRIRQRRVKRRKSSPLIQFAIARAMVVGQLPNDERAFRVLQGFPEWPYMEPLKDAQATETLVDAEVLSRRTAMIESDRDPDVERANIDEEREWRASSPVRIESGSRESNPVDDESNADDDESKADADE